MSSHNNTTGEETASDATGAILAVNHIASQSYFWLSQRYYYYQLKLLFTIITRTIIISAQTNRMATMVA